LTLVLESFLAPDPLPLVAMSLTRFPLTIGIQDPSLKKIVMLEGGSVELTKAVALDCEMVQGPDNVSMVAWVSIVNEHGGTLYDAYVKPTMPVTDYRTFVSGIRPGDLDNGKDFNVVRSEVPRILSGRILVGHCLHHDLRVLALSHPEGMIRDTQKFPLYKEMVGGRWVGELSLKTLADWLLKTTIQEGAHSPVEDARIAMRLYQKSEGFWEEWKKAGRC